MSSVFARAAARIPHESDWCQGHYGRTSTGETVYYGMADRVCLVGAVLAAGGGRAEMAILRRAIGQYDIAAWNDSHTHAEVLQALGSALAIEGRHHEARVVV